MSLGLFESFVDAHILLHNLLCIYLFLLMKLQFKTNLTINSYFVLVFYPLFQFYYEPLCLHKLKLKMKLQIVVLV